VSGVQPGGESTGAATDVASLGMIVSSIRTKSAPVTASSYLVTTTLVTLDVWCTKPDAERTKYTPGLRRLTSFQPAFKTITFLPLMSSKLAA